MLNSRSVSIFCLLALLCGSSLFSQELSSLRTRHIRVSTDTLRIDSLAVVPGSIILLTPDHKPLPDSLFTFIPPSSLFLHPGSPLPDPLTLVYRVMPFSLDRPWQRRTLSEARIDPMKPPFEGGRERSALQLPQSSSRLQSSGSLSRGISAGNNRDASLQSSLNLQLKGYLTGDFQIEASLSDANIPVQPDGTTQQIQDFDKVYLRIFNPRHEITGGDFELASNEGHFLKMYKKVQGISYHGEHSKADSSSRVLDHRSSLAVVKGKYARNRFAGIEGNQGPYPLTGVQGEPYIQVIAGSEKVYIDGRLLRRGEDADYVMDYNTAEIRFTPRNLMTKDKRVVAEFEYTERSYIRFLAHHESRLTTPGGSLYLQFFTETDARNQSVLQDLSAEQIRLLGEVGDQLDLARSLNVQEVGFMNDRVMYKMVDTLVSGIRYDSVLVHSFHPDSARYQAGFMLVGAGRGNYLQVSSSANGRVFAWVAPLDGTPQGDHEPVTQLMAPGSKQVMVAGASQRLGNRMRFDTEWALSRNDLNTFSNLDREDDAGLAVRSRIVRTDTLRFKGSPVLGTWLEHRFTTRYFDAVERFRPIEFERDWNLTQSVDRRENLLQAGLALTGSDSLKAAWRFELLDLGGTYLGLRQSGDGAAGWTSGILHWEGSQLSTSDPFRETGFLRHRISVRQKIGKLSLEIAESHERNRQAAPLADSLLPSSFSWQEYQVQVGQEKEGEWPWVLKARYRVDRLPLNGALLPDSRAWEVENWIQVSEKRSHRLRTGFHLRRLDLEGENGPQENGGFTMTGRIEDQLRLFNEQLTSQTFIELGSGNERKIDYSYLEVAAGQGLYTWNDYNQNNIQELDEFEPAWFQDQARYIRIYRPGSVYLPTLVTRFNQTLILRPSKGFLNRFSSRLAYRIEKKSARDRYGLVLNPVVWNTGDPELITLNGQLRHTLSYQPAGSPFGVDLISQRQSSKVLMINGEEIRHHNSNSLNARYRINPSATLLAQAEAGLRSYESGYFPSRNHAVDYLSGNIRLEYQPDPLYRIGLEGEIRHEADRQELNSLLSSDVEASLIRQITGKGQAELSVHYIWAGFEGIAASPSGYQMLKGFQPGHNGMVRASVRYRLAKNLQLELQYEGRKPGSGRFIHNGQLQVRALF